MSDFLEMKKCIYRIMHSRVSQSEASNGVRHGSSVETPSRLSPNNAEEDEARYGR